MLGGNSLVGQVAAGTLIGAIGREIGSLMQFGLAGAITDYGSGGQPALIDGAVNGALHEVGGFGGNLIGNAIGQLAAPLIGELAHKLGLSGFGAGVFTSLGTTITAQLVSNAFNVAVLNQPVSGLFAGFNPGAMITNVAGLVGGAIGSYLAAEVVTPVGPEGAFGSSVGSAVGAYFGTILIPVPVLGTAVGSFLGGVIGTLAGNTASGPAEAWGTVRYSADEHRMIAIGFGGNHGGDPVQIANLTHPQVNAVNHLVNWTGAQIDPNSNATHTYHQLAKHFWFQRPDGTTYDRFEVNNPSQQLIPMIDAGVMSMLRAVDLVGGDVLMRRGFETSNAPNPAAFATDLQVADDYRTYLDNAAVINALMAAQPESAFTTGWALTLLKAKEIGLDHGSVNDFRSGIMAHVGTLGVAARLDFAPTFDPNEPDTLLLRHASGAEWRLDNTFGPGLTKDAAGGSGNDAISFAGLPIHGITHAAGGAGDDNLSGSNGTDLLDGGAGNDVLNGGEGHDWLYGGDGDDHLSGSVGDDLLVGGRGNDWLYSHAGFDTLVGGEGNDTVVIDVLDRHKIVIAATVGAAFQDDTVWLQTLNQNQVLLTRRGADLVLLSQDTTSQTPLLTIKDYLLSASGVDHLKFADGSEITALNGWQMLVPQQRITETFQKEGGGYFELVLDGNNQESWFSRVTEYNVATQLVQKTYHFDLGGGAQIDYSDADNLVRGDGSGTHWSGGAGNDQFLGSDGADRFFGGAGNDSFFGGAGDDGFDGGAGNDTMDGGTGVDWMSGKLGDDLYVVDSPSDRVEELAGEGIDTVRAAITYALSPEFEVEDAGAASTARSTAWATRSPTPSPGTRATTGSTASAAPTR